MLNTETMRAVDLNADLAEGAVLSPSDLAVLDAVTSASLACGFHAGDPDLMRTTAAACLSRGVVIGAHVSYRDREGFGRQALDVPPAALVRDIVEQWETLAAPVGAVGAAIAFVKPHGALYHRMGVDPTVASSVVEAVGRVGVGLLVAQAGTVVVGLARRAGLRVVPEGFPDRAYLADGRLAPRHEAGALIEDPGVVGRRALSLARDGGLEAVDGTWTTVEAETLCLHGDSPGAADSAGAVRAALEGAGIVVRAFAGGRGPDPGLPRGP
jgi:UPF0271 protein